MARNSQRREPKQRIAYFEPNSLRSALTSIENVAGSHGPAEKINPTTLREKCVKIFGEVMNTCVKNRLRGA